MKRHSPVTGLTIRHPGNAVTLLGSRVAGKPTFVAAMVDIRTQVSAQTGNPFMPVHVRHRQSERAQ